MSNLSLFLKQNKKKVENKFYAATKSLADEKGNPLEWEFRKISTQESEEIRETCTHDVQVTGKPNQYRQKFNSKAYMAKLIATSVVTPNLLNAELQDSYDVKSPEELLVQLVDDPGEYNKLMEFINVLYEFTGLEEKVDEAKN